MKTNTNAAAVGTIYESDITNNDRIAHHFAALVAAGESVEIIEGDIRFSKTINVDPGKFIHCYKISETEAIGTYRNGDVVTYVHNDIHGGAPISAQAYLTA